MKKLRATWRLLYFAVYTSLRISQILLNSLFRGFNPDYALNVRQRWVRHLLPAIGVRIQVEGTPPDFPCILMGNHRSYLDPIALLYHVLAWPVSKAEVEKWPIVGYGAKVTGILFLKRESQQSRKKTLDGIAAKVSEGHIVLLFPEGTTTDLLQSAPFKRGGFQLAASNGLKIVPVAIEYRTPADYWIGDDTFLAHFFRRFGEKEMHVRMRFGEAMQSEDAGWMQEAAQTWIDAQLIDFKRV